MRWIKRIGIFLGILVVLVVIAAIFNIIQVYRTPTTGNTPGIAVDSRFFATNLLSPERFDYICFNSSFNEEAVIIVSRLCALEGETVEFRNGVCYVNGENQETGLILNHTYYATGAAPSQIIHQFNLKENIDYRRDPFSDTTCFSATEEFVKKNPELKRYISNFYSPEIEETWDHPWSGQNFGPITVPADHYFVIGDNRDDSRDSRYIGPVHENDVVGVVFYK